MRPSGLVLVASWRTGFSLFLWLGLLLAIFLCFQCIKTLLLAIKGMSLFKINNSTREVQPLARPSHRSRRRDPDIYTVNYPNVLLNGVRHTGLEAYMDQYRSSPTPARPSSSPPVLQPEAGQSYTLPNTPLEPPPYSSLYSEDPPPPYDSLYIKKECQLESQNNILPV